MALRTPWLARHSSATYIASSLKAPRSRMSSNCSSSGLVSLRSSWMGGLFLNHSQNLALRHSGGKKAAAVPFLMVVRASTKGAVQGDGTGDLKGSEVRVRFAPSPTGNLHVGGARTALFNYLYAKSVGGKFILRIEDTDLERSTKESEDALIEDLHWLGLEWDEGPFKDGDVGPYRQSERTHIYKEYANKLLASGHVYRCFCTDEELEAMREDAKAKNMPPRYMGKWGTAKQAEIDEELGKGTPFTYRFRVPQEGSVTIHDLIRGEVSWKKDTLGDFVVMRSNGQPVYNFCVAVDDATMKISHVIRAEEHLPNTLRQALIYNALGFSMPQFGHVSLILAPDRSKLSKRHGATSCGQFREMGYLSSAMVNYLALLGWNDGSEDEIFSKEQIVEKFSIDRITKSGAIFDQTKLGWLNGQHLRMLPNEEVATLFREQWVKAGILDESTSNAFIDFAVELLKNGTEVVSDSEAHLLSILHYPLNEILASPEVKEVADDNIAEVAKALVEAYDSGELQAAIDGDHEAWNKWIKGMGKAFKRKGKRLFMPVRVLLTGGMKGPEVGSLLSLVREGETSGAVRPEAGLVPLADRIQILRGVDWGSVTSKLAENVSQETEPALSH